MLSYCWLFSCSCREGINPWLALVSSSWPLPSTFSDVSASHGFLGHISKEDFRSSLSLALIFVTHVCLISMLVLNYPPVRFTFTSNSPRYTRSISTVPWNPTGLPKSQVVEGVRGPQLSTLHTQHNPQFHGIHWASPNPKLLKVSGVHTIPSYHLSIPGKGQLLHLLL